MISKELLSEVLGYKVELVKSNNGTTLYFNKYENGDYINIHELAHKCKEWAVLKGYEIETKLYAIGTEIYSSANISYGRNMGKYIDTITTTEPEAIFKACQWILDNK